MTAYSSKAVERLDRRVAELEAALEVRRESVRELVAEVGELKAALRDADAAFAWITANHPKVMRELPTSLYRRLRRAALAGDGGGATITVEPDGSLREYWPPRGDGSGA